MNFTEKSMGIVDSCRFCWMCRHICPIGNATGLERNTARARNLGLSLVARGLELSEDIMDNLYECQLCGACTKECVTGWDPKVPVKEVRLKAALEGKTPAYINKLIDNCLETGNAYAAKEIDAELAKAIAAHSAATDTVLFLGADARYMVPQNAVKAIELLDKAGVKFTVLADEPASGAQLNWLISAADETKKTMQDAAKVLSAYKTVIALDPIDAVVFLHEYKEWNIELGAVKTFTSVVAELISNGSLKVKNTGKTVTIQDPYQLSRDLEETEELRTIVSACANVNEMLNNRKDTMWAGDLLMATYMPKVIKQVSADRWFNAKNVGADTIVTACASEYAALKNAAEEGKTVLSVAELVLSAL